MNIEEAKEHFVKVYETEADSVWKFCTWRVKDKETALDIVQDSFMRYWDELSRGTEIRNAKAFLFTVARRLIIDWYRKKKAVSLEGSRRIFGEEDFDPVDPKTDRPIETGADGRFALEAINRMDETYSHILYLSFIEGMGPKEIAEVLGITANAASVRLHRGIEELRKKLNPKSYG